MLPQKVHGTATHAYPAIQMFYCCDLVVAIQMTLAMSFGTSLSQLSKSGRAIQACKSRIAGLPTAGLNMNLSQGASSPTPASPSKKDVVRSPQAGESRELAGIGIVRMRALLAWFL